MLLEDWKYASGSFPTVSLTLAALDPALGVDRSLIMPDDDEVDSYRSRRPPFVFLSSPVSLSFEHIAKG